MAGVFQKAMVWLGLAPDDEYDDYPYNPVDPSGQGAFGPRPAPRPRQAPQPGPRPGPVGQRPGPRPGPAMHAMPEHHDDDGYVKPLPAGSTGNVRAIPPRGALANDPRAPRAEETPTVRPMRAAPAKPAVLTPTNFDDAKEIADRFKASQPVAMDLGEVDRELSRRLIDFTAGICYALGGTMERIRPGSYLIVPDHVEVADDERRRLAGR